MNTAFKPFSLGRLVATPGALEAVPPERVLECLPVTLAAIGGTSVPRMLNLTIAQLLRGLVSCPLIQSIPRSRAKVMVTIASG